MIEKSRLEELIEQGATIYDKYRAYSLKNEEYTSSDFWYKRTAEIKDNKLHYTYEDSDYYENFDRWLELEQLFETEKDAKWALKYQRIPRTEYLDLLMWEDFYLKDNFVVKFYVKNKKYSMYIFVKNRNTNNCRILIRADDGEQDWLVFEEPATEENYEKACDLCAKLFKGDIGE